MEFFALHSDSLLMCLTLTVFFLGVENATRRNKTWKKHLHSVYILVILMMVSEGIWFLVNGNPELIPIHKAVMTAYLILYPILAWVWFLFCCGDLTQYPVFQSKWFRLAVILLLGANAVLVLLSWKNGWVFRVDDGGYYSRGSWMSLTNGIAFSFLALSVLFSLLGSLFSNTPSDSKRMRARAFYTLPVLLMTMAQILLSPGYSFAFFGFVFSFAMILIDSLNAQITQDRTTGLINGHTMERRISDSLAHWKNGDPVTIILCDMDHFKFINDEFGHLTGDDAITDVGQVFDTVCKSYGAVPARLHGDEFLILAEGHEFSTVLNMMESISLQLSLVSENKPYNLSVSWGYALFDGVSSYRVLLDRADRSLYTQKAAKRKKEKDI